MNRPYLSYYEKAEIIEEVRVAHYCQEIFEVLKPFLESHGVAIQVRSNHYLFLLPEGTTRCRFLPVIVSERWKITLPGGLQLFGVTPLLGYSQVGIREEDLPEEIIEEIVRIENAEQYKKVLFDREGK